MVSSTPEGTVIGCRPIRLMPLPDLRDDLAAVATAAGVVTGHQSVRVGDDCRAHAAEHTRHVLRRDVGAATGLGDALQARDDRAAVLRVLELHVQLLADASALDGPANDVALLLQDPGQLSLHLRVRDDDLVMPRMQP